MPIYPYICDSCTYEFDRLQKISDDPLSECPECGVGALRRKLTAAAFHLKGTGWYETDFKNKDKDKDKKGDGKEQGKDGGEGKKEKGAKAAEPKTSGSKTSGSSSGSDTDKRSGSNKSPHADSA